MKRLLICIVLINIIAIGQAQIHTSKWVYAYVPTYQQQGDGTIHFMDASDYDKVTHIGHHGPYVHSDASIDLNINGATATRMAAGVQQAHANNTPILLSIVSWYTDYLPAISTAALRTTLVENTMQLFDTYGYDGVDVDLEPIMSPFVAGIQTANPEFELFVTQLYDSLQTRTSSFLGSTPLLVVASEGYGAPVLNNLQDKLDMINIMTYDMAGPYPGWITWHDSPVYNGGYILPSTGATLPCVHSDLQECLHAGVNPDKLGVGISCDAFRWQGGTGTTTGGTTAPLQSYSTDPSWTRFSYRDFVMNHQSSTSYHYDPVVQMSYASRDEVADSNDEFWSFNDQASCEAMVDYVWTYDLGGTMIWELGSGYIPDGSGGFDNSQLCFIYDRHQQVSQTKPLKFFQAAVSIQNN